MNYSCLNARVNKGTISRIIIDRITEALLEGELKPGDRLPTDTELAQMLGVGRNSVREALKIMEAFGILDIRRSEGIFICSEYTGGMLDPLLYGVMLGNSREEAGSFYRAYFQSLLLMDAGCVTEERLAGLEKRIDSLRVSVQKGESACRIYKAILAVNAYLAEFSGNRITASLNEVLEKLCRKSMTESVERWVETGEIMEAVGRYDRIAELLKEGDLPALYAFLADGSMCDFNKK